MKRNKADWRRELLAVRAAIAEAERRRASLAMVARVRALPWYARARSLLGYVPIGAEADVIALLAESVGAGRPVFVPAHGPAEDPACWAGWQDGVPASTRTAPSDLEYPAIVLVPGVGFDEHCIRLGRGRGFYDRALSLLRHHGGIHAVGVAFEPQIVPALPRDTWDEPMDVVVSDVRVIATPGRSSPCEASPCS
jgi:5-formyltetrahydrofolate cyclo-ligase